MKLPPMSAEAGLETERASSQPRATTGASIGCFRALWVAYGHQAVAFAFVLFGVVLLGSLLSPMRYRVSATVVIAGQDMKNEWDLLANETKDVDVEERAQSRAVLEPVLRQLRLFPPSTSPGRWFHRAVPTSETEPQALEAAVEAFRKQLHVERLKHSGILQITLTADDPLIAAHGANAVAYAFINSYRAEAINSTERVLRALDEELRLVTDDLERLHSLRDDVVAEDAVLQELARQVAVADAKMSYVMSRYKPDSPLGFQSRGEKNALEAILKQRIVGRRATLREQVAREQQRFQRFLTQEPSIGILEALIAETEHRYQGLLDQRGQTQLKFTMLKQSSQSFGTFSVLDEALPPPRRSLRAKALVGLLIGGTLGGLSLFLIPAILFLLQQMGQDLRSAVQQFQGTLVRSASDAIPANGDGDGAEPTRPFASTCSTSARSEDASCRATDDSDSPNGSASAGG